MMWRCHASKWAPVSPFATHRAGVVIIPHNAAQDTPRPSPKKKRVTSDLIGCVGENTLLETLPEPGSIKIRSAEFIKSSVSFKTCPDEEYPEFAVIGRSNVGKSSLINLLTGQKNLALISKTPGKTKTINHFLINNQWYLVDLPGYGFSRMYKKKRMEWNAFTREYFLKRGTLANVLLLVDASIKPLTIDLRCADWLGETGVPFTVVFTKVDKRTGNDGPSENVETFKAQLSKTWDTLPVCFATSARCGQGQEDLLRYISRLCNFFTKNERRTFGMGGYYTAYDLGEIRKQE